MVGQAQGVHPQALRAQQLHEAPNHDAVAVRGLGGVQHPLQPHSTGRGVRAGSSALPQHDVPYTKTIRRKALGLLPVCRVDTAPVFPCLLSASGPHLQPEAHLGVRPVPAKERPELEVPIVRDVDAHRLRAQAPALPPHAAAPRGRPLRDTQGQAGGKRGSETPPVQRMEGVAIVSEMRMT
jgi:hypothetical protein